MWWSLITNLQLVASRSRPHRFLHACLGPHSLRQQTIVFLDTSQDKQIIPQLLSRLSIVSLSSIQSC